MIIQSSPHSGQSESKHRPDLRQLETLTNCNQLHSKLKGRVNAKAILESLLNL